MNTRNLRSGHLLVFAGAFGTLVSLWGPWFSASAGGLTLSITGWRMFHWGDIEIAALSVLIMFFVLSAAGVISSGIGQTKAGWYSLRAGGLIAVQSGYQLLHMHDVTEVVVKPGWGALLCVSAAGAIMLGGLWAAMSAPVGDRSGEPERIDFIIADAPLVGYSSVPDTGRSIAPPGFS